jgi:diaminopimelate decarboxylase
MSYQYNGRLKPAEVLVCGNQHCLIRERETFADMTRGVAVPERLQK